MKLLYTDETNVDPKTSEFFIYGGVSISGDCAYDLSKQIDDLRQKYGYKPADILKFNTRERPKQISQECHAQIKKEVMGEAIKHEVKVFTSFILHRVAKSIEVARRNEINRICYHFNCYLYRTKDFGLVLIDNFNDRYFPEILREKFSVGIRGLPYTKVKRLEKILGFHAAIIGSSNFSSLVDIVMGSLRFAVNNRNDIDKANTVSVLLSQLRPLFIEEPTSNKVSEISIFFSPKVIKSDSFLKQYCELYDFLLQNKIVCAQQPVNYRTY